MSSVDTLVKRYFDAWVKTQSRKSRLAQLHDDFRAAGARIRDLEFQVSEIQAVRNAEAEAAQARIRELESVVTKFLDWNGTDYADDEAREYALVGICEEAYTLIPHSQSDREADDR